jgi:hypothetical protein
LSLLRLILNACWTTCTPPRSIAVVRRSWPVTKEIAAVAHPFPIVSAEPTILGKLVWPLRHAKGSYALGNYLAPIALCGMVGEMVAILLWDIAKVTLQGHPITETEQRAMFGNTFEKLGQERRVDILHALKLVDDHHDGLRQPARDPPEVPSFPVTDTCTGGAGRPPGVRGCRQVVAVVLGVTFKEGSVVLRPELMTYLTEKGIVQPQEEVSGA